MGGNFGSLQKIETGSAIRTGDSMGKRVMRMSSSLVAPSAIAVLSTVWLSGTAASQTATSPASPLPSITVQAPRQAAKQVRPQRQAPQLANTVAARRTSPAPQSPSATAQNAAPGPVMARIAALEKTSSNCTDGCQTSSKYGNQPWNGCSGSAGSFSATCRNVRNYKTYQECRESGVFLAWKHWETWWYCSSLHAAGKLSGEKLQVAELKRSGRR